MHKIVPNPVFDTEAKEAAKFYCSVFKNSEIESWKCMLKMGKLDIAELEAAYKC